MYATARIPAIANTAANPGIPDPGVAPESSVVSPSAESSGTAGDFGGSVVVGVGTPVLSSGTVSLSVSLTSASGG